MGTALSAQAGQECDSPASACTRLIIHILKKRTACFRLTSYTPGFEPLGALESAHTFPFKQFATILHVFGPHLATSALEKRLKKKKKVPNVAIA